MHFGIRVVGSVIRRMVRPRRDGLLSPIRSSVMSVLRCPSCNLPMTSDEAKRGACPDCGAAVDAEKRTLGEGLPGPIWALDPSHSKCPAPKRTEDDREVAIVVLQGHNQRV